MIMQRMLSQSALALAAMSMVFGTLPVSAERSSERSQRATLTAAELIKKNSTVEMNLQELSDYASAVISGSNVKDLQILNDNDVAFWEKIKVIRSAEKELRLVYFIFSNDATSSFMAKELIKAADRGVDVKIIVDYITNYSSLDMFLAMQNAVDTKKGGSIDVRFYNRPTRNTILDAAFLTAHCDGELESNEAPTICQSIKNKKINKWAKAAGESRDDQRINISNMNLNNGLSGLYLSGLYSKDSDVMAKAVLEGQQINLEEILKAQAESEGQSLSAEDLEGLKTFIKLAWSAKTNDNIFVRAMDSVKLKIAFMLYGESKGLNKLYNSVTGVVPFGKSGANKDGYKNPLTEKFANLDRSHLTDYTHHKLLLADGDSFVMGGRNVEDSYHVSEDELVSKYLFMDTDIRVDLKADSQQLKDSYDKIFNFRAMSASLEEVQQHAPNDMAASLGIMRGECLANFLSDEKGLSGDAQKAYLRSDYRTEKRTDEFKEALAAYKGEKCVELRNAYSAEERQALAIANMNDMAADYAEYDARKGIEAKADKGVDSDVMSASDRQSATLAYLENVQFDKDATKEETKQMRRHYGLWDYRMPWDTNPKNLAHRIGRALKRINPFAKRKVIDSTRYIHDGMVRGMESVCAKTSGNKKGEREKVILHNAYFAPPSNLITAFANMIDGTWDCRNVDLVIITNSIKTTDLNVVNVVARHGFLPIIEYDNKINKPRKRERAANFEYYEYKNDDTMFKRSLHSKVTVLGKDDIIIGSANADYRSYLMDTNNAMYIKNAPDLVADYTAKLENLINTMDRPRNTSEFEAKLEVPAFISWTRDAIKKDDIKVLKAMMIEYGMEKYLEPSEGSSNEPPGLALLNYVKQMLDITYERGKDMVEVAPTPADLDKVLKLKSYAIESGKNVDSFYDIERTGKIKIKGKVKREYKDTVERLKDREEAGTQIDDIWKAI